MNLKKPKICALLLLTFGLTGIYAQETLNAAGGSASGSGGTTSYSIGQVVYNTVSGVDGSIIQGVQQPYEISVVTGLKETLGIDLTCGVYPNPTSSFVKLMIRDFSKNKWY